MNNNEKFLDAYSYENAGQARAIASHLGYSESFNNGEITFSKPDEKITYSLSALKEGNLIDRENRTEQSKDRVLSFFDKNEAVNNFEQYSQFLKDNHDLVIVKWDKLKEGKSLNNGASEDGYTIIDLQSKVAYTGNELYQYAYEKNQVLDGMGTNIHLPLNGLDNVQLSESDIARLKAADGTQTKLLKFSIEDNASNRNLLDNEKIKYVAEDGNLKFEGKASAIKYFEADNVEENKKKLKKNEIDFSEVGNKIKIEGVNARKLAIAAITLVYPVAGIALMVIPQRKEIKNDLSLSKSDIAALKEGNLISKANEKGERTLMQLDKETNGIVSVKAKDLSIPNKIHGVQISPIQKEQLKNGKEINVNIAGKDRVVKLDLNSPNGLYVEGQRFVNKESVKEQIPSTILDAKQRLDYVGRKGIEGIDQLFTGKTEEQKHSFLTAHNLLKDYQAYKTLDKSKLEKSRDIESVKGISSKQSALNENIKSMPLSQSEKIDAGLNKGYGRSKKGMGI